MNAHDIKLTFRNLKRNKLYSALSISGFAFGFAVCIIIALYTYNEFTIDHCYPNYDRISRVIDAKSNKCDLDYNMNAILREKYPEVEQACPVILLGGMDLTVKTDKHFARFKGMISTTNDFYKMFSIRVVKHSGNLPFEGKESAVITESLAKSLFPDDDPLGKSILIFGLLKATVTAIIEDFPKTSSIQASLLLNSGNENFRFSQSCNEGKCINLYNHFLLLKRGTNLEAFTAKLNKTIGSYHPDIEKIYLQKLKNIYLTSGIAGNQNNSGNRTLIIIFISIGIVILVLSIVNYLNFYISLQYTKLKEIGIKKIHGASFRQLMSFSLFEVSVSIFLSVILSLFFVSFLLPIANPLLDRQLDIEIISNPVLLMIFTCTIIVVIAINSFAPFYIHSNFNIHSFLSGSKSGRGKQPFRNMLTVFQFIISIVLLASVITLYKQISFAKNAKLGFNKELLIRLNLPYSFHNQEALKQNLNQLTFCEHASLSQGVPGYVDVMMGSSTGEKSFVLQVFFVDIDFLKTMGIRLKDGRPFLPSDMGKACIINETAFEQYGWDNIENRKFNNGQEGGYQVIGVTENFHVESLRSKIQPLCLIFADKDIAKNLNLYNVSIRLTSGDIGNKMREIEKQLKSFIPDEPMDYSFYDDNFNAMYKQDERLGQAIGMFALIAFILTCMGVFGQIFQVCVNRTKEIGIRKINGASVSEVMVMLSKDFVKLIALSFVIATPIVWFSMHKWLQGFAYKTELSWWIFALAGVIALGIALLTVSWQSWRAATRNPVEALRYE
jgi:putative ABC transport system permease protein